MAAPGGGHVRLRKCAGCGERAMAPEARFEGEGFMRITDRGEIYACPACGHRAPLRDVDAVVIGWLLALFWAAVGWWAFTQGPLWYATHFEFLYAQGLSWFVLMDVGALLFYGLLVFISLWMIWRDALRPVLIRIGHPVAGENRSQTLAEQSADKQSRRQAVLSFFVYSLLAWAPLIGLLLLLDLVGVNLHGEGFKFAAGGLVVAVMAGAGVRRPLIFFGMLFWLAMLIGLIFLLG